MTFAGKLLVALPALGDSRFERTVIFLLNHDDEGALGVVLNRPTATRLRDVLPRWEALASDPAVLHAGGPVQPDAAIAVGLGADGVVATVDLENDPTLVEASRIRVFAGYAGWSAGQLEDEIAEGAWIVVDAHALDPFSPEPDDLWSTVLRRQPGTLAWMANLPEDLSVN